MKLYQALDLKKLQTPLFEEFFNTVNAAGPPGEIGNANCDRVSNNLHLPPKSKSPSRAPSRRFSSIVGSVNGSRFGKHTLNVSNASGEHNHILQEIQPSQLSERKGPIADPQKESFSARFVMEFGVSFMLISVPSCYKS